MSYYLFLDDERIPQNVTWVHIYQNVEYVIVRDYNSFCDYISKNGLPTFVTFDHDLADEHYDVMLKDFHYHSSFISNDSNDESNGSIVDFDYGKEKTGFDCAKWMVDYCIDNNFTFPEYQVHSMNPVGKERIFQYVEQAKEKVLNFI